VRYLCSKALPISIKHCGLLRGWAAAAELADPAALSGLALAAEGR